MSQDDYLLSGPVFAVGPNRYMAWAYLSWTRTRRRVVVDCPSREAAEAAHRLLSGEAERGLRQ